MRKAIATLFFIACLIFIAGCGSQPMGSLGTGGGNSLATAPVGLTVTDTPPSGVTVLFFQLNITAASLMSSSGSVPLLSSTTPIPINVTQLLTEAAFLGSKNVAAGTYTGLSVTLANAQLTIFNDTGAAIGSCANQTVCQLPPTTTPVTLSFTTAPFPITLTANSPLVFKLDIHLDTVIQSDLTVNLAATNGVTVSQFFPPSGREIPFIGKLVGIIQGVGSNQFTLQSRDGRTFTILVNSSTTYNYPSSVCSADAFSCLAKSQVVKVAISLQSDGTLLATAVDFIQTVGQQILEGTIVGLSTSGTNTIVDLILQEQPFVPQTSVIFLGCHARAIVPSSGVTYSVDSGGFVIPSGLSFASASDLQVGQEVMITVQGSVSTGTNSGTSDSTGPAPFGPPSVTFTASSIELERSQIVGTVAAVSSGTLSFTLSTLPVFFVPPSPIPGFPPGWVPVEITVQTTAATTFVNFSTDNFSSLAVNDVVSVSGWVFSTPKGATATTVAAENVQLRPGPMPLF
jgi:hypothetical protein